MNPDRPNRSTSPGPAPTNPIQTGAIIAVSILAAVSLAVYESPEVRHYAATVRRQIAAKLRQLSDHVDPEQKQRTPEDPFSGQPLFNRPEDAEGVRETPKGDDVEADEESQRRQQEEIEYWNKLAEQQRQAAQTAAKGEGKDKEGSGPSGTRRFEDFLEKDNEGGFVYNTGADTKQTEGTLTRRQGRAVDRSNPFSDENGIELESTASSWAGAGKVAVDLANSLISPRKEELTSTSGGMNSDIYNASCHRPVSHHPTIEKSMESEKATSIAEPLVATADPLIDLSEPFNPADAGKKEEDDQEQYATAAHIRRPLNDDPFAAIHAWNESASSHPLAQSRSSGTTSDFFSPLPTTPKPMSETSDGDFGSAEEFAASAGMEVQSLNDESEDGIATPTESMSIIGEQESLGGSDDGRHTPGSWTEVGSSVSGEEIRQRL